MKRVNNNGPRTDPWGTTHATSRLNWINSPLVSPSVYELTSKTQTSQWRYHRYRTNLVDKRLVMWSRLSKAIDRSNRVSAVTLPSSIFKIMSFSTLSKAVSVEGNSCKLTDTDLIDRFFQDINEFDLL